MNTNLCEYLCSELSIAPESLVFVRHSNSRIEQLGQFGGDLDGYTLIQPDDTRYDFSKYIKKWPAHVVAIIHDKVFEVYRLTGNFDSGMIRSLVNDGHKRMDIANNSADRPGKRYHATRMLTRTNGKSVIGWENRSRTTVQYFGESFFDKIQFANPEDIKAHSLCSVEIFESQVSTEYAKLISNPDRIISPPVGNLQPISEVVQSKVFIRDSKVAAFALVRAKGICEICKFPAPFNRKPDDLPYLEVHHKIRLADGGPDTVENVLALCPNCHRKAHYG